MAQYINKSAVVAEIERRRTNIKNYCIREGHDERFDVVPEQLSHILSFIDALNIKEVDLDKEIDNVWNPHFNLGWDDNSLVSINHKSFESIAKHFFELGISINHPITASDKGMAEEIILNLEKIEKDYNLCLIKEKEWVNKQLQKGE